MKDRNDWLHTLLDGKTQPGEAPVQGTAEEDRLDAYREALQLLEQCRETAPNGFSERVMATLSEAPDLPWMEKIRSLWPGRRMWALPALAGALAVLLLALGIERFSQKSAVDRVAVTFEIHAAGAQRVELVGSFNGWRRGEIVLKGPDATGHWRATVELPAGRHEYLFLVDGKEWVTDPRATAYRSDGFGHRNALIEI